nr:MAG TPA_asm: hypothetical protein [Caudoviricetes sp.]
MSGSLVDYGVGITFFTFLFLVVLTLFLFVAPFQKQSVTPERWGKTARTIVYWT